MPLPTLDLMAFSAALSDAMAAGGMTQEALAKRLGDVKQNSVSSWLGGRYEPKRETVWRVEDVLGLEPGALSKHLGYIPVGAAPSVSVEEAIAASSDLDEQAKQMLLGAVRAAKRQRPKSASS